MFFLYSFSVMSQQCSEKLLVLYTCSPILPKWIYEHGSLYVTRYIYQLNLMLFHSTVCSGVALQLLIIMMMIIIIIIIVVQLCVVSQQWSVIRTFMNKPGDVCLCVCVSQQWYIQFVTIFEKSIFLPIEIFLLVNRSVWPKD